MAGAAGSFTPELSREGATIAEVSEAIGQRVLFQSLYLLLEDTPFPVSDEPKDDDQDGDGGWGEGRREWSQDRDRSGGREVAAFYRSRRPILRDEAGRRKPLEKAHRAN